MACVATSPSVSSPSQNIEPPSRNGDEIIEFETGNPEAGMLLHGKLTVCDDFSVSSAVLIEGIPGIMTSADFCLFLRSSMDMVQHIRLLRPKTERNRYMAAILVRADRDVTEFTSSILGRPYLQGLVAETCRVRALRSAEIGTEESIPSTNPISNGLFEGPAESEATCAVCLEPLKSDDTALITILCNHQLHAACISKCELNQCPVCRHTHELKPEASVCMSCDESQGLWMCVICAYVGCGKYKSQHAYNHFKETQHPFAMNLTELVFWTGERVPPNSVWDYVSERFVNRLVTADEGKVVEMGGGDAGSSAAGPSSGTCCRTAPDSRLPDSINEETFATAVEESRMYHMLAEYRANEERMRNEHKATISELESRVKAAEAESSAAKKARTEALQQRKTAMKRADAVEKEMKELREKNEFLRNLNDTVLQDQERWKKRVDAISAVARSAREERDSLKEELRDLMMHLQTQATISAASSSSNANSSQDDMSSAADLAGADVLRVGLSPRERLALKLNRRSSNR